MPARPQTLCRRIEVRIARRRDDAFLTCEFLDLAGEREVLRALRELTGAGKLIRNGVDALAGISRYSGRPIVAAREGLLGAARRTPDKLGVRREQTEFQRACNEGRFTQVPISPAVRVKGRLVRPPGCGPSP